MNDNIEICLGCGKPTSDDCGCPAGTGFVKRDVALPSRVRSGRELLTQ